MRARRRPANSEKQRSRGHARRAQLRAERLPPGLQRAWACCRSALRFLLPRGRRCCMTESETSDIQDETGVPSDRMIVGCFSLERGRDISQCCAGPDSEEEGERVLAKKRRAEGKANMAPRQRCIGRR